MKNLKKVLAVVLALSMMLSTFTVAFAADSAADKLGTLGLLTGTTATELEAELTRAVGIAMVMKSLGDTQEEATAKTEDCTFTDMNDFPWAKGFAALAYEAGITTGKVAGVEFDPAAKLTAKEFVTFQLRALGYTDVWANVATLVEETGLEVDLEATTFTKGEAADVMFAVLSLDLQGEDATGTLIEKLIADEVVTEAAAVAVGLVEATPEALEVVSVVADNLKQLVVTFNKALDGAGDDTNYELTGGTSANITANANYSLSADEKVVTITLEAGQVFGQQETVELTIDSLVAADETELDEVVVEDILVLDMTIPSVVSAEVVGNDTIKVNFSEPMDNGLLTKANYEVDDGALNVKDVTLGTNNMSAYVILYSDLEDGDYPIDVSNVEDFEGFTALSTTLNVTVVEDESAPVVVGFEDADELSVTLIFDEDIEIADGTAANFYHTNSNNPVAAVVDADDVDGNKLTLDFTGSELPAGTVYVYIEEDSVNNLWDVKNDKIKVVVTVTLDETAPAVDGKVDVTAQDTIEITFTEDIDDSDLVVILLDEDGEDTEIGASTSPTDEVLEIQFDEDLYGDYSVVLEDLMDIAGNTMADTTLAFNCDDETKPVDGDFSAVVYDTTTEDQIVRIDFDEEMAITGQYSVLDITKYEIDGTSLESLDGDLISITAIKDNTGVEIVIPGSEMDVDNGDAIVIARIADAAGNYTAALTNTVAVVLEGFVAIKSVEMTDNDTLVVTLADELDTVEAADFVIIAGDDTTVITPAKVKHTVNADDESVFTFTLVDTIAATITDNAKDGTGELSVHTVAAPDSENVYGESLKVVALANRVDADDVIAPEVDEITVGTDDVEDVQSDVATLTTHGSGLADGDYDVVDITFTEDINAATLSLVSFEVEDYDVLAVEVITGNIVRLILNADVDPFEAPEVGLKVTQNATIQDLAGNAVSDLALEIQVAN